MSRTNSTTHERTYERIKKLQRITRYKGNYFRDQIKGRRKKYSVKNTIFFPAVKKIICFLSMI